MSAIVSDRALAAGELRLSPIAHGRNAIYGLPEKCSLPPNKERFV